MKRETPEVSSDHITVDNDDLLIFTVKNGLNKIGMCRMGSENEETYCLYSYDEPVLTFTGSEKDKYGDKTFTECGSIASSSSISKVIDDAFRQLCAGSAPEYALPPILKLMSDGLYAVSYLQTYPTTGENMFFWSGYGIPKHLKCSSRYIRLIDENKVYSAPFLIASHRPSNYDPAKVRIASETSKRGDELFGISLHISGFYSLLLKGHHAASAAVIEDRPYYTMQIQPVREIWKQTDEDGNTKAVGLCSSSFRIPFSALDNDKLRVVLAARKFTTPETYLSIKNKLNIIKDKGKEKGVPKQLNTFAENYPDADMVASAQGINELTKPMLDALLTGSTTYEDKVIISDNYYSSVTAACNYLRFNDHAAFLDFALNIMKNPELSATYTFVAGCLAKVTDAQVKAFFEEVIESKDPGYNKILAVAKTYIDNYDKQAAMSREDYMRSLPDPHERERREYDIVPLSSVKETVALGGAEMLSHTISGMMKNE